MIYIYNELLQQIKREIMKKIILVISLFLIKTELNYSKSTHNYKTKMSHLSSQWYHQEKNKLEKDLDFYLSTAKKEFSVKTNPDKVKVLIVPHAGFYYSGLCAATAYQTLLKMNKPNNKIKNIIILAPSHTKSFKGIAIPNFETYQTVLGKIDVNKEKLSKLKTNKNFKIIKNIFNKEHAIEIQLPFLQRTIKNFKFIPLIVGQINNENYEQIAQTIKKIIDDNTLIVISTDFIHYGKNYQYTPFKRDILDFIRFVDSAALEAIGKQSFNLFNTVIKNSNATICGKNCIRILLKLLEKKSFEQTSFEQTELKPRLTCYYTSAQLTQARIKNTINIKKLLSNLPDRLVRNSVSYAGLIFTTQKLQTLKEEDKLTNFEKKSLLELAFRSIQNEFLENKLPDHLLWPIKSLGIQKQAGAFVTLNKNGNLKGCIGRIVTNKVLFKTVQEMAKAAAFNDKRFNPLKKDELKDINISISVLTKPKQIQNYKEIELGKHGIILKKQTYRGSTKSNYPASSVFLPKVPTGLGWNIKTTLEQLSLKAGLSRNDWQDNCNFEVFESFEIN